MRLSSSSSWQSKKRTKAGSILACQDPESIKPKKITTKFRLSKASKRRQLTMDLSDGRWPYNIFKNYPILFIARKTINEELIITTFFHSSTQKFHSDLRWHNSPLCNYALDHGSETIHIKRHTKCWVFIIKKIIISLKQEQTWFSNKFERHEIQWSRTYPNSEPDLISALRRSPALKCVNLKCLTTLAHWVPLPLPGPPTNQPFKHHKKKINLEAWLEYIITQHKNHRWFLPPKTFMFVL